MLATSYSTNNCSYSFYSTLIKQIKKIISNLKLYNLSNIEDVLIAKIDTKKAINDLLSFFYEQRKFDLEKIVLIISLPIKNYILCGNC